MLDRVGRQLGHHQGERCRLLGADRADPPDLLGAHLDLPVGQTRAARPVHGRARGVDGEAQAPVDHLVEVDRLLRALQQRLVHERDRGDAPHGLGERLPRLVGLHPPRLHPQQRRDGLEVVLHPVVDLADRRVLGDQLPLPTPQLGHVAHQDHGAGALAGIGQRHGPQGQGAAPGLHVRAPGRPPHQHQRQRLVHGAAGLQHLGGQLREGGPGHVAGDPEAVEGGAGVRGGPLHHSRLVELDDPVAHAGRAAAGRDRGSLDGERPVLEHRQQARAEPALVGLVVARVVVGLGLLGGEDGQGAAILADRDHHAGGAAALALDPGGLLGGLAPGQQPGDLGALGILRAVDPDGAHGPDGILVVDGRSGRRTAVRDGERAVVLRQPQHEVGTQQIGQEVPVPDEVLEPVRLLLGEGTVVGEELGQARHGARICVGPGVSANRPPGLL